MKRMSCRGSDRKWVRGREECCLVGASVYGRELLVQIDDSDVRRGARDGDGLERERWDRKVVEVKMDRDAGCSQWDGWCRVRVCKCLCVCVCL